MEPINLPVKAIKTYVFHKYIKRHLCEPTKTLEMRNFLTILNEPNLQDKNI